MELKITRLDHDGYNGREYFARTSDEGTTVLVIGMEAQVLVIHEDGDDYSDEWLGAALDSDGKAAFPEQTNKKTLEPMWICLTADGRTVQLMNHEVKVVR